MPLACLVTTSFQHWILFQHLGIRQLSLSTHYPSISWLLPSVRIYESSCHKHPLVTSWADMKFSAQPGKYQEVRLLDCMVGEGWVFKETAALTSKVAAQISHSYQQWMRAPGCPYPHRNVLTLYIWKMVGVGERILFFDVLLKHFLMYHCFKSIELQYEKNNGGIFIPLPVNHDFKSYFLTHSASTVSWPCPICMWYRDERYNSWLGDPHGPAGKRDQ